MSVWGRLLDKAIETAKCEDYNGYNLAWNVKMHTVPNFRKVFKTMGETQYYNETAALLEVHKHLEAIEESWDGWLSEHWDMIVEDMRRTFDPKETDTMKYVRPDLEKKYNLKAGTTFDTEFEFQGRSGGHLVLIRFDGRKNEGYDECTNEQRRRLAAYIEEVGIMVSKRDEEFVYQAAFQLGQLFERRMAA
jgi:hypothetical protein